MVINKTLSFQDDVFLKLREEEKRSGQKFGHIVSHHLREYYKQHDGFNQLYTCRLCTKLKATKQGGLCTDCVQIKFESQKKQKLADCEKIIKILDVQQEKETKETKEKFDKVLETIDKKNEEIEAKNKEKAEETKRKLTKVIDMINSWEEDRKNIMEKKNEMDETKYNEAIQNIERAISNLMERKAKLQTN